LIAVIMFIAFVGVWFWANWERSGAKVRKTAANYVSPWDYEASVVEADKILEDYRRRKQRSRVKALLKSPSLDGMPRSSSIDNVMEIKITDDLDDEIYVDACEKTIECIEDDNRRNILIDYYIKRPIAVELLIADSGYSKAGYYIALKDALYAFASIWPTGSHGLLVDKE
jgi:ArpU family phage transcriptional regulator